MSDEITAVAYGGLDGHSGATVKISRDMGKTWNVYHVSGSEEKSDGFIGKWIGFITPNDGWLILDGDVGAGTQRHYIYQTSDGGKTWEEIGNAKYTYAKMLTGAAFASDDVGFLCFIRSDDRPLPTIHRTKDRGKTWQELSLPLPVEYLSAEYRIDAGAPAFHGPDGVLPVTVYDTSGDSLQYVATGQYVTSDYGETWAYTDADSITLYSLNDNDLKRPLTQIPYYQRGGIQYMSEDVFEQFKEGHQPWLSGAVDVASVMCVNLAGVDSIVSNNENIALHTATEFKTKDGLDIKLLDETDKTSHVAMAVSGLGTYDITLEAPDGKDILFIREIIFHPDLTESGESSPKSVLLYNIQDLLDLTPAPSELPDYESGDLVINQLMSDDEWTNGGGHQPWRKDPYLLMRVTASNLVPETVAPDYFKTEWVESGNTATTKDGLTIKLLSPDDPSLNNPSDAKELTYELTVPRLGLYEVTVTRPYDSAFFVITKIIYKP